MSKTLIKTINNVNSEGVAFTLTEPAALTGNMKTTEWYVSWDKIGRALFGDEYSDADTVCDLESERDRYRVHER